MDTVIGSETTIEGKISTEASLRIEGKVFGEVHCQGDLTIGEGGIVETIVSARNIIIAGTVRGNITASGKLHLLATGKFSGNTKIASLIIDEGGIFSRRK
jgi:cytoskeletal protein CcmA (bactofilin family)